MIPSNAQQAVGAIAGEIATRLLEVEPEIRDGHAVASVPRDLLKLVCVERHHATGRVGVGYVQGFGLQRGALASSIAHDAHNIVAVGADDADILRAIAVVAENAGGLAVVADGEILAQMALPIAGILSDLPLADTAASYERLEDAAGALGSTLPSPFGLLAFMALSVIPEARVTDRDLSPSEPASPRNWRQLARVSAISPTLADRRKDVRWINQGRVPAQSLKSRNVSVRDA